MPKQLIQFGKREYREKKPLKVTILRVRDKAVFKRGFMPSLIIKQHELIHYVVVADYDVMLRLYLFTPTAILLRAENIEKNSILLKNLIKSSRVLYTIP